MGRGPQAPGRRDPLTLTRRNRGAGIFEKLVIPKDIEAEPRKTALRIVATCAPDGTPWPAWLPLDRPIPLFARLERPATPAAGEVLARFEGSEGTRPAVTRQNGQIRLHFDPRATLELLSGEAYVTLRRPLHTYAPGLIALLPGAVRLAGHGLATRVEALRHRLGGGSGADPVEEAMAFPQFPIDLAAEAVRALVLGCAGARPGPLWPAGRSVVCLCHDVDTAEGQQRIPAVAREEEKLGLRSCWYIVGDRYPIDHGLMRRLRQAGHEIGLHGVRHDQRLAFLPRPRIERRLDRCRELIERHGIEGFRSPALLSSPTLEACLVGRFRYDSSVPDCDVHGVSAPRRGCSTVFPFWRGELLELPLTLPLDDRLLLLGQGPDGMYSTWKKKVAWIDTVGGMAVVTTHVEPHLGGGQPIRATYARLLCWLARRKKTMVPMLPRDVARWWRSEPLEQPA